MKVTKAELTVTNYEAQAIVARLRNQAQLAYIPEDPDFTPKPGETAPDLFECAARVIEAGGCIRVQGRVNVPPTPEEPPVDTDHNPPRTLEPQEGNPTEPGREKVLAHHPDVGQTAEPGKIGDRPQKPLQNFSAKREPLERRPGAEDTEDATEEGFVEEDDLREHPNRDRRGKETGPSSGNRSQRGRKEPR